MKLRSLMFAYIRLYPPYPRNIFQFSAFPISAFIICLMNASSMGAYYNRHIRGKYK